MIEFETAKTPEETRKALWRFGLMFAETVAGDGYVTLGRVQLISGKGGPALLWLAVLKKAGEMIGFEPKLREANVYRLDITGKGAIALASIMPAIGLNPKAERAIEMFKETGNVQVQFVDVRKVDKRVVAIIKVEAGPWKEEYNVYLGDKIALYFGSPDVDRVYQKAHVLKLLGVRVELKKGVVGTCGISQ